MNSQKPFHALSPDEALQRLDSRQAGLDWDEVAQRHQQYGPNRIGEDEKVNKFRILLDQLLNPLVLILVLAAGISLLADHVLDAVVIGVIILINTGIGYFQESQAEESLKSLRSRTAPEALVQRVNPETGDSIEQTIPSREVIPGDIVLLNTGDKVPTDARILSSINLEIDESMLTGESLTVQKTTEALPEDTSVGDRTNIAFAGTNVTHGRGKAAVFATAENTQIGRIASLLRETEETESPLKKQAGNLGKYLAIFAVVFSAVVFAVGMLNLEDASLQEVFLFSLASAISSIPEGLPAVMTITLAVGVNRMAARNAIIRKLRAVDTLGAATVICSDKTGTLTTNQMTVREVHTSGRTVSVTGSGFEPSGEFLVDGDPIKVQPKSPLFWTIAGGVLCNNSQLIYDEDREGRSWKIRGDPTEGALIAAAEKAGLSKLILEDDYRRWDEIPFDSRRKYMATFHQRGDGDQFIFVKGAPEEVIEICSQVLTEDGMQKLSSVVEKEFLEKNNRMAEDAMRVLAVAYCSEERDNLEEIKKDIYLGNRCLALVGLIGMIDPPRREAEESIRKCEQAGIRVIMATGDHPVTARAIGRKLGLLGEEEEIVTGRDIGEMSDQELDSISKTAPVFARVSPDHKHRLVESLKRNGQIVAMTGDGVNDAPALKAAQVGVAMGIAGTDVAQDASDMVLTDDNFASIVSAVEEGRVVFENIRKVVKFLVATNFGEDLAILGALVFLRGLPLILSPVQILWINLVTDGLLDVTIAMEPKEEDVMQAAPRPVNAGIINKEILLNTLLVSAVMAAGTLFVFARSAANGMMDYARTMAFATMAMFQVFNALNVRSRKSSVFKLGLFSNKYLNLAIIASTGLLLATIYIPFMQNVLGTAHLGFGDWMMILPITASIFVIEEIRKFLVK